MHWLLYGSYPDNENVLAAYIYIILYFAVLKDNVYLYRSSTVLRPVQKQFQPLAIYSRSTFYL